MQIRDPLFSLVTAQSGNALGAMHLVLLHSFSEAHSWLVFWGFFGSTWELMALVVLKPQWLLCFHSACAWALFLVHCSSCAVLQQKSQICPARSA